MRLGILELQYTPSPMKNISISLLSAIALVFPSVAIAQEQPPERIQFENIVAEQANEMGLGDFATYHQSLIWSYGVFYCYRLRSTPEVSPAQILAYWGNHFAENRPDDNFSLREASEFQAMLSIEAVRNLCAEQLQPVLDSFR